MKKIFSIASILFPLLVGAQSHTDSIELVPVVVTATAHAVQRGGSVTMVDVVGSEQLEAIASTTLTDGLRLGTGLRVEYTCQNCGQPELKMNGLGGEYTQVLIDGRPVMNPLAAAFLLEQLPTAMIDRVEVMRGGGSSLYGAGAIGGVVNVITREPLRNTATASSIARLIGGKTLDMSQQFSASMVNESHRAGLFLFGQQQLRNPYDHNGDGYSELGQLRSRMLGMRGYVRLSDYSKLGLEYHNIGESRRGGDLHDLPETMAHIAEGSTHDIHNGLLRYDLFTRDGFGHLELFASAQHVRRQSYLTLRSDGDPYGSDYWNIRGLTTTEGLRYSHSISRLLFLPATVTAGIDHTYDYLHDRIIESNDTLEQRVHNVAAYAQSEWRSHCWTLLAGLRADKNSLVEKPVVSPRVSVRYAPSDHFVFRTGYSSGFRAPQLFDEDLHEEAVNGSRYILTNATSLHMERSHSFNVSVDLCHHHDSWEADLLLEGFYTYIDGAFVNVWLFDDTAAGLRHYERQNADGARVGGLNAELRFRPAAPAAFKAGLTLQRSRYTGQGLEWKEGNFEKEMERAPNWYGFLQAQWMPTRRLTLSADATLTGSMLVYHAVDDDNVLRVHTPAFFDLSLRVNYSLPLSDRTTLDLQGGVLNLFNAYQRDLDSGPLRDSDYIYGPLLPRSVYLGAKLTL